MEILNLIEDTINGDLNAQYTLYKIEKEKENLDLIFKAIENLSTEKLLVLGRKFKEFPFGCDLNEIMVDVVSIRQNVEEIKGGFRLVDRLGFPIHVCSYVVAELAEKLKKTPLQLMEGFRSLTQMPIDVDHFGKYGPMRYPEEIVKCPADCYRSGKVFNGCPRGRIHKRLIEKEKAFLDEREGWVELVQSISVSFMSFQKENSHSASIEETLSVVELAKEKGKGTGAIICVGDGKDDLLKGLKACIEHEIDEIVIEGGPYNKASNPERKVLEATVMARITSVGKIVATNGQYENELRLALRGGLNSVISGFPGNHHAYMSGYTPSEATVNKFGLPKVMEIMAQEVTDSLFPVPCDKESLMVIAKSAKFLGKEYLYPEGKLGNIPIGDAHWLLVYSSPLSKNIQLEWNLKKLSSFLKEKEIKKVGLLGCRFVAWGIAKAISPFVKEILVSDKDKRVEEITYKIFKENLNVKITPCNGSDEMCIEKSDISILTSFIPSLIKKFTQRKKVLVLEKVC
ncbi:MAG: 5,10-methenyltetrahydromethanopterin hydrogenase cofactor biosynthesis protein HmdC [Desulfurobacteriaceae bacterium]